MQIHIALYCWKASVNSQEIDQALADVKALARKVPGVLDIMTGKNTSKYAEGYSHVIIVRGEDQAAIDAYRAHPDHQQVAERLDAMEERAVGVDVST